MSFYMSGGSKERKSPFAEKLLKNGYEAVSASCRSPRFRHTNA